MFPRLRDALRIIFKALHTDDVCFWRDARVFGALCFTTISQSGLYRKYFTSLLPSFSYRTCAFAAFSTNNSLSRSLALLSACVASFSKTSCNKKNTTIEVGAFCLESGIYQSSMNRQLLTIIPVIEYRLLSSFLSKRQYSLNYSLERLVCPFLRLIAIQLST